MAEASLGPQWSAFKQRAILFAAAFAILWFSLWSVQRFLPYLRNGAAVVNEIKRAETGSRLFASSARTRIVFFGNSRVLAGFKPNTFDDAAGQHVSSFNMGLPGTPDYLGELEAILLAGNRPTHVFVQFPPEGGTVEPGWLDRLRDSKRIITALVPFRDLPRDVTLFIAEALRRGGVVNFYRFNRENIQAMLSDRGWFFIRSQSHYPGDRLPDDYRLPTDAPQKALPTAFPTDARAFDRLMRLARQYDFQVLRVPVVFRQGEAAEPDERADDARTDRYLSTGPAYLLYPPSFFSDPVHLNAAGAERYSRDLARIFSDRSEN